MKLDGSVAIVTGGAQGVGRGIVEALLGKGAKVCIADINKATSELTVKELAQTYGDKIFFKECDVTKDAEIKAVFGAVQDIFGSRADIMVNNAGIIHEFDFARCVAINLEAQIRCTHAAVESMGVNNGGKGGVVIFTASITGVIPFSGAPVYGATKHAVVGYVRGIASCPSYSQCGLRFNCVCPSFVDTPLVSDAELLTYFDAECRDTFAALRNSVDMLRPSDVGVGCIKLIEDDTLNGKALVVNHGDTGHGDVVAYIFAEPPTDTIKF
ncbi:unnamed protein product [Owenia fusiformis]|uniref:15-hydroxyprostaglandin dehydrogenase [NAD(+)] n=1 Tax=Owenia fusiformis TaxID=6347 RepID=A0A8S4PJS1_OWEFU|nr:unnamed protein product [Owenia fusiformis]